jgi:hypothetical protein
MMSNLVAVICVFVGVIITLHYFFVYRHPKPTRWWHQSDYVWLTVALLGILPPIAEIGRLRSSADAIDARADASGALSTLRMFTEPESTCRTFTRTEHSPPDFDRLVASHQSLCEWARLVRIRLPSELPEEPRSFKVSALPPLPSLHGETIAKQANEIAAQHEAYVELLDRWRDADARTERADWELNLLLVSPFLLAGAVALRLTRVTAQIKGHADPRRADNHNDERRSTPH